LVLLAPSIGATVLAQNGTPTPVTATVLYNASLRAGPSTAQAIVGKVRAGQLVTITTTSEDGNWVQLDDGQWIAAVLVKHRAGTVTATTSPTTPRRLVATVAPAVSTKSAATATVTATVTTTIISTGTVTVTRVAVTPSTAPIRLQSRATLTATASLARTTITPTLASGATALRNANLRAGPGTNYTIVGGVRAADALDLQGQTSDGSWLQLRDGSWIAAFLVTQQPTTLPTVAAALIAALPTAVPPATSTPQPPALPTTAPSVASTAVAPPASTAVAPTAAPSTGTSTFVVTRRRLWNPWENGGSTDGPSVHCGQGRTLVVNVLDEQGNRINGVAVQAEYGAKELFVTGSQGKGDGIAEFVLGGGQDVKVVRDADGSPVSSEAATGLSTDPRGIDRESLISAGYCQDDASCQTFANNLSCIGHYSWSVTFERRR